jgi:aminoglycoside phosphotransferase (APT) family kinase protein
LPLSEAFPAALDQYLRRAFGEPASIETLGGKSGAGVRRVRFVHTSVIVKASTSPNETRFYQAFAPLLRAHGIPLPAFEFSLSDENGYWLVLEDIPHPLPKEFWRGDRRLVAVLARLHSVLLDNLPAALGGYRPAWTDELTEKALACFSAAQSAALRPLLTAAKVDAAPLFRGETIISADPNPLNWGIRDDGSLVLFDWERITLASPAIDLAIIVGGLGERAQFRQVTQFYRAERPDFPLSVDSLAAQIALAKLWTVLEYLSEYTDGSLAWDTTLDRLTASLPAWLGEVGIAAR